MFSPVRKTHPAMKIMNSSIIDLPAPSNLSIWWNLGSLLGMCLAAQIMTGLFLSMHYTPHVDLAFSSISHITQDVSYGWLLRNTHANMASWFFICLYLHIGRGVYYNSFLLTETWNIGVILLLLSIVTAFLGYVLPWGQMSFWGATVITNLLSAVPYIGTTLVEWLWGGFAVDNATLNRFFALHFMLPFILLALVVIHLLFLHQTGSNNPLGVVSNSDKILFHSYYSVKDSVGFILILMLLSYLCLFTPNLLTDPENFITANPMVTPIHIKPEWYFLWPYAILRSIPNKLGGVIAMVLSMLILMVLPFTATNKTKVTAFYPLNQLVFWLLVSNMILLTWIGGCPVEAPYEVIGKFLTVSYFMFYIVNPTLHYFWDYLIKT